MTELHRRVSYRIKSFLTNSRSADDVAAEIIKIVTEQVRKDYRLENPAEIK